MSTEAGDNIDDLWKEFFATRDGDVKNQIISHYLFLVIMVVKRLMPQYASYSDKDDLLSSGVLGLIDAVNKFDGGYGVKFQTYATVRIRGEIIDYIRKQDWAPTSLRKKISTVQQGFETLEVELGRRPTEQEVAGYLGVPLVDVQKTLQKSHMFNLIHFESMLYEQDSQEPVSCSKSDPHIVAENKEMAEILKNLITTLPEKERMVITLHYYEGLTMKSIAKILQVSEPRVSQIHSKVLMEMRKALGAEK